MNKAEVLIASDSKRAKGGIYHLVLDREKGKLAGPWLYYECTGAKTLNPCHYELAAAIAKGDQAGVLLLDTHQKPPFLITAKLAEECPPCSILQDKEWIYTANDEEGTVMVYRKDHGQLRLAQRIKLGIEAKCRQLLLLDSYLYVVCSGWDCIRILDPRHQCAFVRDVPLPKGSGPCRLAADAQHRYLYVLNECSNEIFVYQIGAHHSFRCHQIISTLPQRCSEICKSTAICISPNGQFLYTATSGMDVITCFAIISGNLLKKEIFHSGGVHPQDIILDETGCWLIVLNHDDDRVVLFQCDPQSGEAIAIRDEVTLPEGSALTFAYYR